MLFEWEPLIHAVSVSESEPLSDAVSVSEWGSLGDAVCVETTRSCCVGE
jgi:hypothetical protein